MTLNNNRAPLQCYFKLCALFRSHWWIQTGVTVRKRPIWVKIDDFESRVTLQFDVWPWKTIGHLFYASLSSMHYIIAISELKLELQSGNAQSRSKSMIFFSCVTLKFDGWPSKSIGHLFYVTSSFVQHFVQKWLSWFVTSVTLTFDLWPWPFAWTLIWSMVITLDNFMIIWWWEHSKKNVTDRQTDRKYHSVLLGSS